MVEARRETLELMPEGTAPIMYALFALAFGIFLLGIWWKIQMWRRGRKEKLPGSHGARLKNIIKNALFQVKTVRKKYAGPMHAFIFWGFAFLFLGTVLVLIDYDITQPLFNHQFLKGWFYLGFETVLDAAGLSLLLGLGMALWRRVVTKPESLKSSFQDVWMLGSLFFLTITGYLIEALRLAIRDPEWGSYSFVGILLKPLFDGWAFETQSATYQSLWWVHALVTFAWIASIPYTKFHHIITSPANIYASTQYGIEMHKGQLPTPFNLQEVLSGAAAAESIRQGAKKLEDLSWRQLLSLDACTQCGRCQDVCPAYAAGRPLSPMKVVLDLRDEMHRQWDSNWKHIDAPMPEDQNLLVNKVIQEQTLWSCVTCRACMEACPVMIEHVPVIVELRRGLVAESRLDKHKTQLLQNLANSGNAYGFPNSDRGAWAEGLEVPVVNTGEHTADQFDVVYWVGCSGSFDPRNQQVTKSIAKILKSANVKFAIMGENERCTGDPARRLGEEGRYQEMVIANVETLKAHGVKRMLTQCPHCFNTLKNEYKGFGLELEVEHHSQFIGKLLAQGKIKPTHEIKDAMTYHDSCYLGRYNDEYDAPRAVVAAAGSDVREMPRSKENSFCCGGGGSNMWFEVKEEKERISQLRVKEALGTGAKRIATACPFCMTMIDDAAKLSGSGDTKVQDIAEILADSLGPPAS
jgi:Fe-S oxidoreductase/nitrate reductase gamma subunit